MGYGTGAHGVMCPRFLKCNIMKSNYAKLDFGRTLNESGPNGFITSDECFHYGSVSGCDSECPVLLRGDCKIPEEVLPVIENIDLEDIDLIGSLKELYKLK